ncbi:hypothetical protein HZA99_03830 [Candidatus Woesearchaeota archaeon]|nr:hypothetical protein [Candidatus Woesearchaeota archaeon]
MFDYPITFLIVFIENIIPAFMPPTWLILGVIYNLNPILDPLLLAFFGAIASTCGRFILAKLSIKFKYHFIDKKRAKKMKELGKLAKKNPVKAFLLVLLLSSVIPFPSNALFIIVGFSEAIILPIFLGFFIGRFLQYYIMIISTNFILTSIAGIFSFSAINIILFDIAALIILVIFTMIDWVEFLHTRKIKFIPFRFRRKKK